MFMKRSKGDRNKLVPIRQLAEFSADPKGFDKNRGKVRNKAAVRAGNVGEARVARTGSYIGPIVVAIILAAILWIYW